ncbi:PEP/pyruvate-binding domain-containing protein [Desulfobacter sp. UBA2225]|uniref:PEP/pyruvate-binding domain-containing protein n=1 Tax=Desulfobacter sp. UBA2225 TaxID=1961413 RepID=UPI002579C8E2|nr:PEP/pyruvate-binding domain-containing protein [Desulfobacter sp. UBA2225]
MKKLISFLKKFFSNPGPPDTGPDAETLRVEFQERYHHFKMLLNANNRALEIMTEIEQALSLKRPFGNSFIRTKSTAITVNLLRLLKNLEQLSGGKYNVLYIVFDDICLNIKQIIEQKKEDKDERFIIPISSIDLTKADLVGSKMANLGEILNFVKLKVPAGFTITSRAYDYFLEHNSLQTEINRRFVSTDIRDMDALFALSKDIQKMIIESPLPEILETEIHKAYHDLELEMGSRSFSVALRSSAMGEDSVANSFAGQYRSELNVRKEDLSQKYKDVIASKYSFTAITYRLNKGIRDEDIFMSVGCISMVDARSGGVMYTRNPLDAGDDSIFINSAWGLPKVVVDGSVDCDLFTVARDLPPRITFKDIKEKGTRFLCNADTGVCRFENTNETKDQPSISDAQILELTDLAIRIEGYYGSPQDVEWAIDQSGSIYILQSRPLQQMEAHRPDIPEDTVQGAGKNVLVSGGMTIFPGVASGEVFILNSPDNMSNFPNHGILVVSQALPIWASLLNKASAILSEHGTFAGHLANVAREFNVPAIFGIKNVCTLLKTGDEITVDSSRVCIYKGKIDLPAQEVMTGKTSFEIGPVYNILLHLSRYIVPLNLLDPYSPDFKPENCRTLHDITRFAHEKSVEEMFSFGKDHDFSERSSKRLFYKVPMQWWILNLDDGVKEDTHDKYIRLENISSIPMMALWDGIIAVPWAGPPPIDHKGLASVMFQSTTNRALEPGMKSAYTERNYFMISKNFCSFSSRLGYHFSITEALVSERASENYISFRFKGGAADTRRRIRRIQFIAEILTEHLFRVEVREDSLVARVEGYEMDFMTERLNILGYLIMHTRQLDMIMSNESAITRYRKKIDTDIQNVVLAKS